MILPFEPQLFGTAANNGQMVDEIAEKSKIAEGFTFFATQLAGHEKQMRPNKAWLSPILGKLPFIGGKGKG